MKRIILGIITAFFLTSLAFAATKESKPTMANTIALPLPSEDVRLKGTVVYNRTLDMNAASLQAAIKKQSKDEVINAATNDYSLLCEGKLYRFDPPSSMKVKEFLQKSKKTDVEVTAKKFGEDLSVISIR